MGNANGGLNLEEVDNVMAAGLGEELATAVVDALQALPVGEGADSTGNNEQIVANLTEVFDKAQKNFTKRDLGGKDKVSLAAGVSEIVNIAQSMIQNAPAADDVEQDEERDIEPESVTNDESQEKTT